MPVILRHNVELELNLAQFTGAVTLAELRALADFLTRTPYYLPRDCLNDVLPGAYFSGVEIAALDELFAHYRALYARLDMQMVRRAAWLCRSQPAQRYVRHWLDGDPRAGMSSASRLFDAFDEACDWLLLSPAEAALLARGEGFKEVASFHGSALAR